MQIQLKCGELKKKERIFLSFFFVGSVDLKLAQYLAAFGRLSGLESQIFIISEYKCVDRKNQFAKFVQITNKNKKTFGIMMRCKQLVLLYIVGSEWNWSHFFLFLLFFKNNSLLLNLHLSKHCEQFIKLKSNQQGWVQWSLYGCHNNNRYNLVFTFNTSQTIS